jgi:hypothetical protein
MTVITKSVTNRREVSYQNYDQLLADVETLAGKNVDMLGNWSFPQIIEHLAIALETSIDGLPFRAPWLFRTIGKLFLKKKFLHQSLPPGFQIPDDAKSTVYPDDAKSLDDALEHLRTSIARCKQEDHRADHPLFDKISREDWDLFNLRHAEMHMSFVKSKK